MRRTLALIVCAAIATPVFADPDPPPHPNPLPADDTPPAPPVETPPAPVETPPAPPADPSPAPVEAPPPPSKYRPPTANPALPIVTMSTMPVPIYARDPDIESRTPAWILTGVTVAFAVAAEVWWLHRDKFESTGQPAVTDPNCGTILGTPDPNCYGSTDELEDRRRHYERIFNWTEGGLVAGVGLSAFVAGYLWSRHYHPLHRVGFAPAANGGSVSIGGDF
jgi:hypothetical protein